MRAVLLGLSIVAALSGQASAQAFGFVAGTPLIDIPSAVATDGEEPYEFEVTPPAPDSHFSKYIAYVYPEMGLCTVTGYHPFANDDAGAKDAIAEHKIIGDELDAAFGPAVDEEFGDGEATDTQETGLLNATLQVVRAYQAPDAKIPAGVDRVVLYMNSENDAPSVSVSYEYNGDACLDARNKAIDAAAAQ
jgi:hypothetical protein